MSEIEDTLPDSLPDGRVKGPVLGVALIPRYWRGRKMSFRVKSVYSHHFANFVMFEQPVNLYTSGPFADDLDHQLYIAFNAKAGVRINPFVGYCSLAEEVLYSLHGHIDQVDEWHVRVGPIWLCVNDWRSSELVAHILDAAEDEYD